MSDEEIEDARKVKAKAAEAARKVAPVVGVGLARVGSGWGVKVNLGEQAFDRTSLPNAIDGIPVTYEVVGKVGKRAL